MQLSLLQSNAISYVEKLMSTENANYLFICDISLQKSRLYSNSIANVFLVFLIESRNPCIKIFWYKDVNKLYEKR